MENWTLPASAAPRYSVSAPASAVSTFAQPDRDARSAPPARHGPLASGTSSIIEGSSEIGMGLKRCENPARTLPAPVAKRQGRWSTGPLDQTGCASPPVNTDGPSRVLRSVSVRGECGESRLRAGADDAGPVARRVVAIGDGRLHGPVAVDDLVTRPSESYVYSTVLAEWANGESEEGSAGGGAQCEAQTEASGLRHADLKCTGLLDRLAPR